MVTPLPVWWSRAPAPGNLGDVLTPIILARLGFEARWVNESRALLFGIGSTVRKPTTGQYVWGSGIMFLTDKPAPDARYLAVRGPLTAAAVRREGGVAPDVIGDPALALPLVYDDAVEKEHEFGLVPHYVDVDKVRVHHPGAKIISPLSADPLRVVDEIRSCRAIASSSLHGIVIAHAYGIPAAWVRWSDRLDGDDAKFYDYALGAGVTLRPETSLDSLRFVPAPNYNARPLLDALDALR